MNNRLESRNQVQNGLGWKSTLISGFNKLSNILPDADANSRPAFKDELHAVSRNKEGRTVRSNFTGPGTHLIERLKREPRGKEWPWQKGDPPRNYADLISRRHDISYTLARDSDDIARADRRMLSDIKKARKQKKDVEINLRPAELGIRGKVLAEKFSLLDKNAFVSTKPPSASDRALAQGELDKMESHGMGRPGEMLLKNLGKHVLKSKKRRRRRA